MCNVLKCGNALDHGAYTVVKGKSDSISSCVGAAVSIGNSDLLDLLRLG